MREHGEKDGLEVSVSGDHLVDSIPELTVPSNSRQTMVISPSEDLLTPQVPCFPAVFLRCRIGRNRLVRDPDWMAAGGCGETHNHELMVDSARNCEGQRSRNKHDKQLDAFQRPPFATSQLRNFVASDGIICSAKSAVLNLVPVGRNSATWKPSTDQKTVNMNFLVEIACFSFVGTSSQDMVQIARVA
jgi:hypothetical protein